MSSHFFKTESWQEKLYDITDDTVKICTAEGYDVVYYPLTETSHYKTDEDVVKGGIDLKMKLRPGHWVFAIPHLKQGEA